MFGYAEVPSEIAGVEVSLSDRVDVGTDSDSVSDWMSGFLGVEFNWQRVAAYAWAGHHEFGPGAVVVDCTTLAKRFGRDTYQLGYATPKQLSKSVADMVEEYDPKTQVVILVAGANVASGDFAFIVALEGGASPPQAFANSERMHKMH